MEFKKHMMNSYEVIKRNIKFQKPDRIGLDTYTYSKEFYDIILEESESDINFMPKKAKVIWRNYPFVLPPNTTSEDEFNCIWQNSDVGGIGTCVGHPYTVDDIDSIKIPDPLATGRFENLKLKLPSAKFNNKYIMFGIAPPIFDRIIFLFGFNEALSALAMEKNKMRILADKLADFCIGLLYNAKNSFGNDIHGVFLEDDLGTQQSSLISVQMFENILKPGYRKIIETAHKLNIDAWLHSDGKIYDLIEHFIEIGLDVFNLQHPYMMGIDKVSKLIQGKICLHAPVDVQKTIHESQDKIINEVKEMMDKWNTPNGGFIAYDYGDPETIGITKKNREVAFEYFMEFGGVNRLICRKKHDYLNNYNYITNV